MSGFLQDLEFDLVPNEKLTVVLTHALVYTDNELLTYTIPEGFTCDLASVPKIFRSFATPWYQSARAGVLHDCAVRWAPWWGLSRAQARDLYRRALIDDGVSWWRARTQVIALKIGGGRAWRRWRRTSTMKKGIRPAKPHRTGRVS